MVLLNKLCCGLGLTEVLITLALISVGVSGLVSLQSRTAKQQFDSEITREALALSRSHLETLKVHSSSLSPLEFDDWFAGIQYVTAPNLIKGENADFSLSTEFSKQDGIKKMVVEVAWQGLNGDNRQVESTSAIFHSALENIGNFTRKSEETFLISPFTAPSITPRPSSRGELLQSNEDGTSLYRDINGDLLLTEDKQIVLTLDGGCPTDREDCTGFAQVSGQIYIDTKTQPYLQTGEINIIASGDAYCARYFTANGQTYTLSLNTKTAKITPNGDYMHFNYTCYLQEGWYGNIGVSRHKGLRPNDIVCVGDPTALSATPPKRASRRTYRGQLYIRDPKASSGRLENKTADERDLTQHITHGIAAGARLPDHDLDKPIHQFVIGASALGSFVENDCLTRAFMTRPDSTVGNEVGGLFKDNLGDTVCLNSGALASYDKTRYGHDPAC